VAATEFYSGKRVLVTGGIGFIGSNLAIRLVQLGAEVQLVDSMLPAYGADLRNIEPVRERVKINFSDVRDRHSLSYIVQGEDLIFSLAGQVSHIESMQDPITDLDINCRSQLSLLECCRRMNPGVKIVFASTRQLYGRPRYLPVDEAHPMLPADVNGINKLAAEMYHSLYHQVYGMRTVSLRLTNTYGPRMDLASDKKGFAGIFIRKALRGEKISIYGSGEQRRDFNHVDDVLQALLLAGESDAINGEVFNLGHPRHYSLLEFVEILGRHADVEYETVPFPPEARAIDIGDYYGDFAKFNGATGWSPAIDLEVGLQSTLDFYRKRSEQP
jgi:nucleoside-diphosphate-sugar epimerase